MFGISSGELFFIAIIALIVLGPERLPKATRFAGLWMRRARQQWNSVKDELERELTADELKRSLQDAQTALQDTAQALRTQGDEARSEFDALHADLQDHGDPNPNPNPNREPEPEPAASPPQRAPYAAEGRRDD